MYMEYAGHGDLHFFVQNVACEAFWGFSRQARAQRVILEIRISVLHWLCLEGIGAFLQERVKTFHVCWEKERRYLEYSTDLHLE